MNTCVIIGVLYVVCLSYFIFLSFKMSQEFKKKMKSNNITPEMLNDIHDKL